MKKNVLKRWFGLMGMVMILTVTACAKKQPDSFQNEMQQNVNILQDENQQGNEEKEQMEHVNSEFYAGANLQGSVVEFTDNGFQLSAAEIIKEEGGDVMVQAAPGEENAEDLVTITYSSDVTFEVITMDSASLAEISREATDKQSIKRQTSVLVFGSCQDTYHWTADKVIIMRWK